MRASRENQALSSAFAYHARELACPDQRYWLPDRPGAVTHTAYQTFTATWSSTGRVRRRVCKHGDADLILLQAGIDDDGTPLPFIQFESVDLNLPGAKPTAIHMKRYREKIRTNAVLELIAKGTHRLLPGRQRRGGALAYRCTTTPQGHAAVEIVHSTHEGNLVRDLHPFFPDYVGSDVQVAVINNERWLLGYDGKTLFPASAIVEPLSEEPPAANPPADAAKMPGCLAWYRLELRERGLLRLVVFWRTSKGAVRRSKPPLDAQGVFHFRKRAFKLTSTGVVALDVQQLQ